MQLEERRAAQAAASQTERAAKAVLVAATAAARQGRVLSEAERADAERSVRQPEEYAADQESKRAAQAQVRSVHQRRSVSACSRCASRACGGAWCSAAPAPQESIVVLTCLNSCNRV